MMNTADKISGYTNRPAEMARSRAVAAAGPFEAMTAPTAKDASSVSAALLTGLLVVYPLLATAAAVVVGLTLSGRVV